MIASGQRYDVVSASSLVVVTRDPGKTLRDLETLVKPGGQLLVIEATSRMSRPKALAAVLSLRLGRRGLMLLPWSLARSGRALPDTLFEQRTRPGRPHDLLNGMVRAWIFEVAP